MEKYHGCITHCLCAWVPFGCFFMCCPMDQKYVQTDRSSLCSAKKELLHRPSNTEMYFGIKSFLCCFFLGWWCTICCPVDERPKAIAGPGVGAPTIQVLER